MVIYSVFAGPCLLISTIIRQLTEKITSVWFWLVLLQLILTADESHVGENIITSYRKRLAQTCFFRLG